MFSFRLAVVVALLVGAVYSAGCQRYEPRPLDLAAHRDAWLARAPGDEPVRAFAERLASSGTPVAFEPGDGLHLAEAEVVALVFNPDLRLARLRAGVAAASADTAARWDDPEFSIDMLHITERVSNRWVITPGLAITIPISGRLAAEKARADAAMHAALDRVAEAEWRVRRDVRHAWLDWSAATLELEQQQELLDSMVSLVASTSSLAEAGELLPTEAALFSLEQSQRAYELVRIRGRIAEGEQHLRSLLGLSPEAPVTFSATLSVDVEPHTGTHDELSSRSLLLARLRQEYEAAEQTLRREIRKQYPDLTIGPLYETDQGQSRIGFLGGFPIPVFSANSRGIAEAKAERELARAAFETTYERIVGDIAATRARLQARSEEREAIVADMAPLADRQLADARRLLDLGESGGIILLESLVRAHDTKRHLIDVRREEARALVDLAFLIGPEPIAPTPDTGAPALVVPDEVNP